MICCIFLLAGSPRSTAFLVSNNNSADSRTSAARSPAFVGSRPPPKALSLVSSTDLRQEQRMSKYSDGDEKDEGEIPSGSSPTTNETAPLLQDRSFLEGFASIIDSFGRAALEKIKEYQQGGEDCEWIRLENVLDACLQNVSTTEDVVQRMNDARLYQSRFSPSDLYSREWDPIIHLAEGTAESDTGVFTVAQFNVLAEGLSVGPDVPKPFNVDDPKDGRSHSGEGYGGFSSLPHRDVSLDFSRRRWRLLEVLLGSRGEAPFDLIALQEVDRFYSFFAPVLRLFGYEGIFMPKKNSPCVRYGWYSDGCCLFWKKDRFDLVSQRRVDYRVGNQLCILATLRHRVSGKAIVAAVTHLKASAANEKVRKRQVLQLLPEIDDEAKSVARTERLNGDVPILILGDFNADPPRQLGFSGESSVGQVLKHKLIGSRSTPASSERYRSAYEINDPAKLFTTWKIRGKNEAKRVIDYIFYGGPLNCTSTLDAPSTEEIEPSKLPGFRYPSDHLLIAAKFKL